VLEGKELLLFLDIKSHRNADDGIIFADSSFCVICLFCKRLATRSHIFVRYFSILVKRKQINKRIKKKVGYRYVIAKCLPTALYCFFLLFFLGVIVILLSILLCPLSVVYPIYSSLYSPLTYVSIEQNGRHS